MLFAEIKNKISLRDLIAEHTEVNSRGWARCPWHEDKRPSLKIDEDKGLWYCFPCCMGGDIYTWVQRFYNVSRGEALKILAEKAGIPLDGTRPDPVVSAEIRANQKRKARRELFDAWSETTWRTLASTYRILNRLCRRPKPEGWTEEAWLEILSPLYHKIASAEAGLAVFESGTLNDQLDYFKEQTA